MITNLFTNHSRRPSDEFEGFPAPFRPASSVLPGWKLAALRTIFKGSARRASAETRGERDELAPPSTLPGQSFAFAFGDRDRLDDLDQHVVGRQDEEALQLQRP